MEARIAMALSLQCMADGLAQLLANPIVDLPRGGLTVSIRDRQGNVTRVERTFSVRKS